MQLIKVLLLALCVAAAAAADRPTCQPHSSCQQPFRGRFGREVFCRLSLTQLGIFCMDGVSQDPVQPASPAVTIPQPSSAPAPRFIQPSSAPAPRSFQPSVAPQASGGGGLSQSSSNLQNLQGQSNLGVRFGSRLQGQAQQTVQGLQALAAQRGRQAADPAPRLASRGGFFRGL